MNRIKKILFFPILPTLLIFILGLLVRIDTIDCRILETNCSPEIYEKLESLKGKSLFLVNFEKTLNENGFNSETILLQDYQKKFPGTVVLRFTEEKVSYQLEFEDSTLFISEFGNILQNNQDVQDLPKVNWNSQLSNEVHLEISKILKSLSETDLKIEKITRKNSKEIIIIIRDHPPIIIDDETIDKKLAILDTLLKSREIEEYEEPIKEIDLRYNLPVLRTTQ